MISFLLVALACLAAVQSQESDPTKVCLPDVYQSNFYSFQYDVAGVLAYDFPNKKLAVRTSTGFRQVFNLADVTGVSINETDGKCVQLLPNDFYQTIAVQCLPASAEPLGNVTQFVGLNPGATGIEAWQVDVPGQFNVRVAITTTTPSVLVVREYRASGSTAPDVSFFTNPQTSIDDKSIFDVPDVCPPSTPVG